MNNLLDTHTFLWYIDGDKSLSHIAKQAIEKDGAKNFVSMVSIWEIAIKVSLGKLLSNTSLASLEYFISYNGFELLPVTVRDALTVASLPFHHNDPFDRMLIAQALNNNLGFITKDDKISNYNLPIIW